MPMATIELPQSMVDAMRMYAARESVSVLDFIADLLKKQYGYERTSAKPVEGRGMISAYASPEKRAREREAWGEAVKQKWV